MKLGNLPKTRDLAQKGKVYWKLSIGREAVNGMYFNDGWRAFEFVLFAPYEEPKDGELIKYRIKISFAYWLPFYKI